MSVVGRFVVLSLAGSFVSLFVLSMGRSFILWGKGVACSFVCVRWGEGSFVGSFFHWVVRSFVCPSFW